MPNTLPAGPISVTVDAGAPASLNFSPVWRDHYDLSYTHLRYANEPGFVEEVNKLLPRSWRVSIGRWEIGMPSPSGGTSADPLVLKQVEREFYRGGNTLAEADDPSNYNFTYLDSLLTALNAQGVEPYLSLDYMPFTLASEQDPGNPDNLSGNPDYTFSNGIRTSPPADPAVYARVIRNVIRHVRGQFEGSKDFGLSYFEIGNEPELNFFWTGTRAQWIAMYNAIAAEVDVDPDISSIIKLGGGSFALPKAPMVADIPIGPSPTFLREFLEDVGTNNTRLDFLSYHSYSNNPDDHFLAMIYIDPLLQTHSPTSELINAEWGPELGQGVDAFYDQIEHGLFRTKVMMGMQIYGVGIAHEALFRDPFTSSCTTGQLGLVRTGPPKGKPAFDVSRGLNKMNTAPEALLVSTPAGTFVMAGKDTGGTRVVVVFVAEDPGAESPRTVNITVNNLPWGAGNFTMNRYEVSQATWNAEEGVKLVESQSLSGPTYNASPDYTEAQLMIWELTSP